MTSVCNKVLLDEPGSAYSPQKCRVKWERKPIPQYYALRLFVATQRYAIDVDNTVMQSKHLELCQRSLNELYALMSYIRHQRLYAAYASP